MRIRCIHKVKSSAWSIFPFFLFLFFFVVVVFEVINCIYSGGILILRQRNCLLRFLFLNIKIFTVCAV